MDRKCKKKKKKKNRMAEYNVVVEQIKHFYAISCRQFSYIHTPVITIRPQQLNMQKSEALFCYAQRPEGLFCMEKESREAGIGWT